MVLNIEGTAHPAPEGSRKHVADFNAAEIGIAQLQNRPVLVEHAGPERGKVLSNWQGPNGELRIMATVDCPEAERQLCDGTLSELSLGTSLFAMDGSTVHKMVKEVSLVERGARDNCLIDTINGKRVRTLHKASNSSSRDTVGARIIRPKPVANHRNGVIVSKTQETHRPCRL